MDVDANGRNGDKMRYSLNIITTTFLCYEDDDDVDDLTGQKRGLFILACENTDRADRLSEEVASDCFVQIGTSAQLNRIAEIADKISGTAASPSSIKRKFQFQNNRTSPYEPQIVRHSSKNEVFGYDNGNENTILTVGEVEESEDPIKLLKDNIKAATGEFKALNFQRPENLLNKRKQFIEYSIHQNYSSSSFSELSPTSGGNLELQKTPTVPAHNQNSRQISPASCSSDIAAKSCGLCGLMPSCSTTSTQHQGKGKKNSSKVAQVEAESERGGLNDSLGVVYPSKAVLESSNYSVAGDRTRDQKYSSSMDRSVDSIGSCSLDVDADSTDFSDTSGSFNLLTPSSAKDFPREFITRIHERCQPPPITVTTTVHRQKTGLTKHQQTSIVLDPSSGKVNTVLSSNLDRVIAIPELQSPQAVEGQTKKPSYLNLACCVNGYSNLTTYDSKLRQNINKSREVSPIRPITSGIQTAGVSLSGHLTVPNQYPTFSQPQSSIRLDSGIMTDQRSPHRSVMSPEKRLFTAHMLHSNGNDTDVPDNVMNGVEGGLKQFKSTKYFQSSYSSSSTGLTSTEVMKKISTNGGMRNGNGEDDQSPPYKSFIQQRVERIYGPGALAQGFHINRRSLEKTVLSEKTMNSQNISSNNKASPNVDQIKLINNSNNNGIYSPKNGTNGENMKDLEEALPVLRHLRPEFRAQLPISSPKRSPPQSKARIDDEPVSLQYHMTSPNLVKISSSLSQPSSLQAHKLVQAANNNISKHYISNTTNNSGNDNHFIESYSNKNPNNNNSSSQSDCDRKEIVLNSQAEENKLNANNKPAEIAPEMPIKEVVNIEPVMEKENAVQINGDSIASIKQSQTKNGNYFLEVLNNERNRILGLADVCEKYTNDLTGKDISEEVFGYLRSASGKARLLASQKMNQFQGLCYNNLNQSSDEKFPTTDEDLQGFWDMVMLQVNHIDQLVEEIEMLKKNNWRKIVDAPSLPPPQGAKMVKRPLTAKNNNSANVQGRKPLTANGSAAAQKREAQRKQLMELKRKNKMALESNSGLNNVEIVGEAAVPSGEADIRI